MRKYSSLYTSYQAQQGDNRDNYYSIDRGLFFPIISIQKRSSYVCPHRRVVPALAPPSFFCPKASTRRKWARPRSGACRSFSFGRHVLQMRLRRRRQTKSAMRQPLLVINRSVQPIRERMTTK